MPESTIGDAYYVRHIDVLLEESSMDDIRGMVGRIYEALRTAPSLELGEPVWWEGASSPSVKEAVTAGPDAAGSESFVNRIKRRFGITPK